MRILSNFITLLETIKKFFSFIFSKTEEFKKEKEMKETDELKQEIKKDIEKGQIDKINSRFKF